LRLDDKQLLIDQQSMIQAKTTNLTETHEIQATENGAAQQAITNRLQNNHSR
jgi:hypothetical protein